MVQGDWVIHCVAIVGDAGVKDQTCQRRGAAAALGCSVAALATDRLVCVVRRPHVCGRRVWKDDSSCITDHNDISDCLSSKPRQHSKCLCSKIL